MSTATATWNGTVIAETDAAIELEGNLYFPPDSVNEAFLQPSSQTTSCFWKGTASYHDIVVDGKVNAGAAWYYADPKKAASGIKGYVAFWNGVQTSGSGSEMPPPEGAVC